MMTVSLGLLLQTAALAASRRRAVLERDFPAKMRKDFRNTLAIPSSSRPLVSGTQNITNTTPTAQNAEYIQNVPADVIAYKNKSRNIKKIQF